jgi:NCAIR mutase (PurE)-related protein
MTAWAAGTVAVVSAGTSDELVAEECRATADMMGCYCFRLADVSVDGLHRILQNMSGQGPCSHLHQVGNRESDKMLHVCL